MIRLGICGCGWVIRRCYAPALAARAETFEVAAVCDPDFGALDFARQQWPLARLCRSFEALVEARPDAILVASPNALHLDHALGALAAGIPCLVEKPVVRNTADAAALRRAATTRAFAVGALACRQRADVRLWLAHAGRIAPLRRLDLSWHRHNGIPASPWHLQDSGGWTGALADLGTHLADIAGAALGWPSDGIEVANSRRRFSSSGRAASWYGGGAPVAFAAEDRFEARGRIGACELRLSARWLDGEAGDLVRVVGEGAGGEAILEGLFGFSTERRVPHQRVRLTDAAGEVVDVTEFEPGPGLQLQAFGRVLDGFAAVLADPLAADERATAFAGRLAEAVRERCA